MSQSALIENPVRTRLDGRHMSSHEPAPSLMDNGAFLAELEQIDEQPQTVRRARSEAPRRSVSADVKPRPPVDEALEASNVFATAPPAAFHDPDGAQPPAGPQSDAFSLAPVLFLGMAIGGGAAALVFHERLVRLLFGG